MADPKPSDRVRQRIRDEMHRTGLNQRDLAKQLNWSHGRLSKVLVGRTSLKYDDLVEVCDMIGLRLVEAVRDHGLEFVATMTPTELRVHERYRQYVHLQPAIELILDVKPDPRRAMPPATLRPKKRRPAKPAKPDPAE
jgi:hypothetical protein